MPNHAIGDNLAKLAGMYGLPLSDLAKVLGVSPQSVAAWKNGRSLPGTPALIRIGEVFEVDSLALGSPTFGAIVGKTDKEQYDHISAKLAKLVKRGTLKAV